VFVFLFLCELSLKLGVPLWLPHLKMPPHDIGSPQKRFLHKDVSPKPKEAKGNKIRKA